jgi:hypothetical protein
MNITYKLVVRYNVLVNIVEIAAKLQKNFGQSKKK